MKFGRHEIETPNVTSDMYVQYLARFDNGYGASIISFSTHGREIGSHWEVAVIAWNEFGTWQITYDTEVTDNVIPALSDIEVGRVLDRIESLRLAVIDGEIVAVVKELGS